MGEIIHLNEPEIKQQLGEMVRKSVEETLNAMLDAEADEITQAHKYERTENRADTRAGHYTRKLTTKAGEVSLRVPKLRKLPDFLIEVLLLLLLFRVHSNICMLVFEYKKTRGPLMQRAPGKS